MNIFLKVGQWIEKKFPDKITTHEVAERFAGYVARLNNFEMNYQTKGDAIHLSTIFGDAFDGLKKELEKIKSDVETLKTNSIIKSRISGSSPTITPFAQRLPPVQPANSAGGVTLGLK